MSIKIAIWSERSTLTTSAAKGRHAIPKEQQWVPAKFGYADFYGWSEDKARQAAAPEGDLFADYLRKTWFSF